MKSTMLIAAALGLRHGADPDHLAAIDGLSRLRAYRSNGLLFALGHGTVVTLLAVGVGKMLSDRLAFVGPWVLIGIGVVNAWRLGRPVSAHRLPHRLPIAPALLLGALMAAGFETASQFAALVLTNRLSPWLVGGAFTLGMAIIDGVDGLLAASTQTLARAGRQAARDASRSLGIVVVLSSFLLGGSEVLGIDLDPYALPLGLTLLGVVIAIRMKARAKPSGTSSCEGRDEMFAPRFEPEHAWIPREMMPERPCLVPWLEE